MPLIIAPKDEIVQIVRVCADAKTGKHLESLGLVAGADITLLSASDGSMIIRVGDCRLALDRNVARSIIVRTKAA